VAWDAFPGVEVKPMHLLANEVRLAHDTLLGREFKILAIDVEGEHPSINLFDETEINLIG